ncbi:flagellar hook protein FlgE [Cupriavidus taiwanensis]|uniref:Flagellar hook protein FlgE n=1 Tax=Cupriavidus taiwanensis TaxID=164546 RepID=A0A375IS58_9BURK|nr:flagellar hook protein FlgE [Cupriavidus taiwanensis]SOY70311.1 FlgE: Flagellar hook protein [Cupriavidus taiwanensis]SOY70689.1 FlgE: Flagellar hook protein [Cupriavidus taiwanensis]SOY95553.1 FlgE: Flagellar hook protein [Cupriavidus taiwanensis]SOZ29718.1 FlgE: Flagellar hook protein [Cupriavidus taiwanensis]SOZ74344.1 FlgE: Flagellar hook protein [Cupriavidus taiwanensis]
MGFGQGVSGLNAAASNLDVIGNNIANANTVGYKQSAAQFADVYAGTKIGLGVRVNSVVQSFNQGNIEASGRSLDVAITNGNGFFRLTSPEGAVYYSRNGQFQRQEDGRITNMQGLQVTGYPAGVAGGAGVQPQPLVISNAQMEPRATSSITAKFQLDSRATVPAQAFASAPGSPPTSNMFNYSTAINVYDSLGNKQQLMAYFAKVADSAVAPVHPTVAGGTDWQMYVTDVNGNMVGGAPATLAFDNAGALQSPAAGAVTLTQPAANGAQAMAMKLDLTGTTQFGADNDVKQLSQNGYTSGSLLGFSVNGDGTITGNYSNEQTKPLGQIVMAAFGNVEGLKPEGDNVWSATGASGQALVGVAGGSMGTLRSNAVEASNVDLSGQLVNLIVAQRNYQANAQTIKAQDTVMQTLVNL